MSRALGPKKRRRVEEILGAPVVSAWVMPHGAHEVYAVDAYGNAWHVNPRTGESWPEETPEEARERESRNGTLCPHLDIYGSKLPPPPGCRLCLKPQSTCPALSAEGGGDL